MRRAAAGATSAPPAQRKASVASQPSASQTPRPTPQPTPQPTVETATPEPSPSATTVEPSIPVEHPTPEPAIVHSANVTQQPSATAIPIPRPKRKASVTEPVPIVAGVTPPPSQNIVPQSQTVVPPSQTIIPPPQSVSADTAAIASIENLPQTSGEIETRPEVPVTVHHDEHSAPVSAPEPVPEPEPSATSATEIRPSKRLRKSVEPPVEGTEIQPLENGVPLATPPPTQETVAETTEDPIVKEPPASKARKTATKSRARKPTQNTGDGTATPKKPRKPRAQKTREPTPEDAEHVEIAPAVVKMSELCKDLRTGRKSKREVELRNMELAELERKQKAQQEDNSTEQTPVRPEKDDPAPAAETDLGLDSKTQAGPVMRIVNGEIVLDTASLQVDRHADAARNGGDLEDVVENSLTRRINQATYGKRSKTESWDEELTDLFYRGLRIFGTDFMMISKLFPGRSRRQIKLKFNSEERRDPGRIKDTLLGPSETIDITTYSEMTNTVYDDPKVIQQELDEEKRQIEAQHAKEKQAQEELLRNPDGMGDANGADSKGNAAKSKRGIKKQSAKNAGGGTEEVLGSIDDFP